MGRALEQAGAAARVPPLQLLNPQMSAPSRLPIHRVIAQLLQASWDVQQRALHPDGAWGMLTDQPPPSG